MYFGSYEEPTRPFVKVNKEIDIRFAILQTSFLIIIIYYIIKKEVCQYLYEDILNFECSYLTLFLLEATYNIVVRTELCHINS